MKKIFISTIIAIAISAAISAGFYSAFFSSTRSAAASTINPSYKGNITDGLVGWWTFDGKDLTATMANDRSVSQNNGTRSAAGTSGVAGRLGQALLFDGATGKVTLGSVTAGANITVSAWVKTSSTAQRPVFSNRAINNLYFGISSGKAYVNDGAGCTISSSASINNNGFHHVVWINDGSAANFYIDGALDSSPACSRSASAATGYIGWDSPNNQFFPGVIDDLRIYNRMLTNKEIQQQYRMGAGSIVSKTPAIFGPLASGSIKNNLVGWWSFDKGYLTSTTATDRSGQGNDGVRLSAGSNGFGTLPAAGKLGQGLNFDGASSTVSVADAANLRVSNFTLSAWAKQNESSRLDTIMSKGSYSLKIGPDTWPYVEIVSSSTATSSLGQLGSATAVLSLAVYNGKIYGGTDTAHVYRYDGNTTWTDAGSPVVADPVNALSVFNGKLYAGLNSTASVFRYDGGTTWTDVGSNSTAANTFAVFNGKLYEGLNAGGSQGHVVRYDGGTTWTDVGHLGIAAEVDALVVFNGTLYASNNLNAIYRYDGGTTWSNISGGQLASAVYRVFAVYSGNLYTAGDTGNVYRYDGGLTWTSVGSPGATNQVKGLAVYGGRLHAGVNGVGDIYRYDGGTTWTKVGAFGLNDGATNVLSVYNGKIFEGKSDGKVYSYGGGAAVYASSTLSTGFNHLAATDDGSALKLYINGSLAASVSTSTVASSTMDNLLIGASYGSSGAGIGEENFNGILDDVRVYNTALSAKNIYYLAKSGVNTVNKTPAAAGPSGGASLTTGLTNWWTFDGKDMTATTATDRIGGNDATRPTGSNSSKSMAVPGRVGQALWEDGTINSWSTLSASTTISASASIAFWFNVTASSTVSSLFFRVADSPGAAAQFTIAYNQNAKEMFVSDAAATPTQINSNVKNFANQWHHFVWTGDGTIGKLYIDGNLDTATSFSRGSYTNNAIFGRFAVPAAIDDFRIYNRVLSAKEIQQLYRMGK